MNFLYVILCEYDLPVQVFLVMVWNFELYMLPITLVLIFIKNLVIAQIVGAFKREQVEDVSTKIKLIIVDYYGGFKHS